MKRIVITAVAVGLLGLVAGCSHGSGRATSSAAGTADRAAAPSAVDPAGAAGKRASGANSAPVADPAVKIRTADLTVSVRRADDVSTQADRAGVIARRYGGDVYAEQLTAGGHAHAVVTLKVAPQHLNDALDDLSALGKEQERHISTEDVTEQVADVTSRVHSAEAAVAKLDALYAQASKVSDLLEIDQQIADREADLEALQAKQRALAAQTSLATIDLTLTTAAAPPAHHEKRTGFLGGLANGWDAFVSAAGAVATGVGAVLPFALALAVLAAAIWRGRRWLRASRHASPTQ